MLLVVVGISSEASAGTVVVVLFGAVVVVGDG